MQALIQMARGHILAFSSGKWGIVHRELHGDGGFVNCYGRQRRGILRVRNRLTNGYAFNTGDGDDVPKFRLRDVMSLQSRK